MAEAKNHSSKSCKVKDYFVEDQYDVDMKLERRGVFIAFFELVVPSDIVHVQSHKILKLVRQEYYVMNDIGLIGAIGGTLGLFVGLSFLDVGFKTVDWAMRFVHHIKK